MYFSQIKQGVIRVLCLSLIIQLFLPSIWSDSTEAATAFRGVNIQFKAADALAADGYLADHGDEYGPHNGYFYGWNMDHTQSTVTGSTYDAPLLNSSIQVQEGGEWEIELPNGRYNVNVSVGNSVYESNNTLYVEGNTFWENTELPAGGQVTFQKGVVIADGKLTLNAGSSGDTTAIQYIEIKSLEPVIQTIPKPQIGNPAEQNKLQGNKIIISGNQNNEHNALPFIRVGDLNPEINRYMNAEMASLESSLAASNPSFISCNNCSASGLEAAINNSSSDMVAVTVGHLNLDSSLTLGSPTKPVYVIAEGINTNNKLTITVYGTLVVNGSMNANTELTIDIKKPNDSTRTMGGNLWVKGSLHLNNNSSVSIADNFIAGSLTYNSGLLHVQAGRVIVPGSLHINTNVNMNIDEEMVVGSLVSNNQQANISVKRGDLFIQGDMHVNNHLNIETGGIVAIGGGITANQKPIINIGVGTEGETKLKYLAAGLKAEYFTEENLDGEKTTVLEQPALQGKAPVSSTGLNDGRFSVRWTGQIQPYYAENYTFEAEVNGGVKLYVNGTLIIDEWAAQGNKLFTGSIALEAGQKVDIQMEYVSRNGSPKAILLWQSASGAKEVVPASQLSPFATPAIQTIPSENAVKVGWTTAFNADGYEVETDGSIYPMGIHNEFIHEPLPSGTVHYYRVRATSGDLKGEWSSVSEVWTLPDVPEDIKLQSTSDSVTLTWENVRGATGYEVETYNTVVNIGNVNRYFEENLNSNIQRTYRIRAVNTSGPGQWSPILVKSTLPGTSGVLNTTATDKSILITWDSISGADFYDLEVDGAVKSNITGTEYLHDQLEPNTSHTYRIRSKNSNGASNWSEKVTATTLPSVPKNLHAVAGNSSISVEWDEVSGATGYDIEVDGNVVDNGLSTSYLHSDLEQSGEHTYRVRAKNNGIIGQWSHSITRTTLSGVPSNIRTTATGTAITVTWDQVIGAVGYDIEVDGLIVNNGLNLTYVHKDLLPFTEHTYRIRARNAGGNGPWSEIITQATSLGKVQNVKAASTNDTIIISWDSVGGATSYEIAVDGVLVEVATGTSYKHEGLAPNSLHVYRVRAKNNDLTGDWSDTVRASTGLGIPVIHKVLSASTSISIEWESVVGANGYDVEVDGRVVDNGNLTRYVHSQLAPGSKHVYRVRAKSSSALGEWSQAVTAISSAGVPEIISTVAKTNQITVEWTSVSGAASYDLEVDGTLIEGISGVSYVHQGLKSNTRHVYRVRSHSGSSSSEWSEKVEKNTIPEIIVNPGKDNKFNVVVAAPKKQGVTQRTITVTYQPSEVEVQDLSGMTPEIELGTGLIQGTNMMVRKFVPGEIVFEVINADKTIVNSIEFLAKTNDYSKITYIVE